jgi:formylglycine-generating enzyme
MHETFIKIDAGDYLIGLDENIIDRYKDKIPNSDIKPEYLYNSCPIHKVFINNVYISKTLLTLVEFEEFINDTGYITEAEKDGWGWTFENRWIKRQNVSWKRPFGDKSDDLYINNKNVIPALQLSWNDADAYCKWKIKNSGDSVRLPSESEWEVFAGISGINGLNDLDPEQVGPEDKDYDNYLRLLIDKFDIPNKYHPPGLIWEWCSDWFDVYPCGKHNKEFGKVYKVLRGGSLLSNSLQKTKEYRFTRCPTARSPFYGFRIAMETK